MSMKIPVLGSAFGILVAAFIGAVQARDDGRYSLSPLKPWFDSLRSGKGRAVRTRMVSLFRTRIGNPRLCRGRRGALREQTDRQRGLRLSSARLPSTQHG